MKYTERFLILFGIQNNPKSNKTTIYFYCYLVARESKLLCYFCTPLASFIMLQLKNRFHNLIKINIIISSSVPVIPLLANNPLVSTRAQHAWFFIERPFSNYFLKLTFHSFDPFEDPTCRVSDQSSKH